MVPNSSQGKTSCIVPLSGKGVPSFTPFPEEAALRGALLSSEWPSVARLLFWVHVQPCSEVPGRKTRLRVLILVFRFLLMSGFGNPLSYNLIYTFKGVILT